MSNYTGFCNLKENISSPNNLHIFEKMLKSLTNSSILEEEYLTNDNLNLGNLKNTSKQIYTYTINNNLYTIFLNGHIYNSSKIRKDLISLNLCTNDSIEQEIILKSYIHYGPSFFKNFNGAFIFIIWNNSKKELLLCRDHFGIKPLYYSILNNTLIFSSEIKSILSYPNIIPEMDNQGLCELFGINPAHTPGFTLFKNIYEIKPAHYAIFNLNNFKTYKYWELESKTHTDNFEETCNNIRDILEDSIYQQIDLQNPLCAMLSGGIDSSIIVAYLSNYYKLHNIGKLKTLSVNYIDNDKNFIKSDFTPNLDSYYIDIMKNEFNTDHNEILIDTPELANSLKNAMLARGVPGMADIDSSMLLFCNKIKNYAPIAFSGECSDEIFAGYPWFFREDALNSKTFPWSIAINERQQLLNDTLTKKINLKEYIDYQYNNSISQISFLGTDTKETKEKRIISYLTLNWFMQTLLDRAEKMSIYSGLELRVPFCDYRLVQYLWNVPWEMKAYNGKEKGLLRYVVKDLLPNEILNRKKSPYPKTHNPNYLSKVNSMLTQIMNNSNSPINNLLNKKYITEILESNGTAFLRPWFGQLMTGPQLIAYLCQVNMWLEEYNPKIDIK